MSQPDWPDEPLDPLIEEAVAQLLHLHSGHETEADWERYQAWKEESADHYAAAEHAEAIWHRIGPAAVSRKTPKILSVVAGAALFGLAACGYAFGIFDEPRSYFADYRTAIGEQRAFALPDGSQIEADSGTRFDVNADGRSITLYSGQIFLSVRGGPGRSFSVNAAGGTVRTLGTKFAVRRDGDAVVVFVTENAVRVSYARDPQKSVDVHAGAATQYALRDGLQPARPADIHALTAWQRGELSFKNQPLSEVVAELERYRRGKIILIGEQAAQMLVTGVFDIHDPDGALASLSLALPITVHAIPGIAVIYARSGPRSSEIDRGFVSERALDY